MNHCQLIGHFDYFGSSTASKIGLLNKKKKKKMEKKIEGRTKTKKGCEERKREEKKGRSFRNALI